MVQRFGRKLTKSCDVFAHYNLFVCAKHGKAVWSGRQRPAEQCWSMLSFNTEPPKPNPTTENDKKVTLEPSADTSCTRHKQVVLSFFGVTVLGLHISSLSLGLVAMSDATQNETSAYPIQNYTLSQKGILAGMMGCGNSIGNVVLGLMAHRFPVINLLPMASGLFSGAMALAVPFAAIHVGFKAACCTVLLQGLGLSFVYPCVYVHLSKWVVPHEQGKFSWVWSGHQVGYLTVMLTSGILQHSPGGWPSVYYTPGVIGILWGIAFYTWGVSSPAHHQTISPSEKEFIESHLKPLIKDKSGNEIRQRGSIKHDFVPWKDIITSIPMWALLIVQISDLWVNESVMSPVFLHGACKLSLMKVGLLTAAAYFANIIFGLVFAWLAHQVTDKIGLNFSRKFWTAIGLYGGSMSLLLQIIVGRHCYLATFFVELRIVINAATHPGYMSTILNVAPNLAATIASCFNAVASLLASTGSLCTGLIVKDENSLFEWDIVFWTSIAIYIVGCTTFIICGSTETQDWDSPYVTTNWGRMSPSLFNVDDFPKPKTPKLAKLKMFGKTKSQQLLKSSV